MTHPPPVAILLATWQGARFLDAQLQSIAEQSYRNWRLIVSDDGSVDDTTGIVRRFATTNPDHEVVLLPGPRLGATQNFLHLIDFVRRGEAIAFCDQDDVWLPDRLSLGIAGISALRAARGGVAAQADPGPDVRTGPELRPNFPVPLTTPPEASPSAISPPDPPAGPVLHVTRTILCDADLKPLRPAPLYTRPAGFLNALVQACTPGNTMLVDPAGAALLKAAAPAAARAGVTSHDWWSYLVISGAGGEVIRDPRQTVLYRQHGANVMGRNDTARAMMARLSRLGAGDYGGWLRANSAALQAVVPLLTSENAETLSRFATALDRPGPEAAAALLRLGVYRQTRAGTAALLAAAFAGRLGARAARTAAG